MSLSQSGILHVVTGLIGLISLSWGLTKIGAFARIPAVVIELLLGILIGPTLLGNYAPDVSHWLFPVTGDSGQVMKSLSQMAVLALLFIAGAEINLNALKQECKKLLPITFMSSLIPFMCGALLVILLPSLFNAAPEQTLILAGFLGIAFAVSALPVITRILIDIEAYHSRPGLLTLSTATLIDILVWGTFMILLNLQHPMPLNDLLQMIWSHSTLLAFVAGLLVSTHTGMKTAVKKLASGFVIPILSPVFFLSVGVTVHFTQHLNLPLILVIFCVANLSKIIGSALGGKLGGLSNRESLAVGMALNVRGAMEIILSKQALEAGLIEADLFVTLFLLALSTSVFSAPILKFLIFGNRNTGESNAPPFKAKARHIPAG